MSRAVTNEERATLLMMAALNESRRLNLDDRDIMAAFISGAALCAFQAGFNAADFGDICAHSFKVSANVLIGRLTPTSRDN